MRIDVTKSFLPPIDEYTSQLKRVWDNNILTNRGQLTLELESKLKNLLGVNNIIIMNNGTIPIQIALKLFGQKGEIITTPFSYIATSSSIVWENCKPVYVDIDPEYLTIDEKKIEEAITEKTTAILATHVFGNPCNIEAIEEIAHKYDLKVIYDAAHCFAVKYKGSSIFNFGDVSTCSFHATKLFHTGEGGALFFKNESLTDELISLHNFGHNGQLDYFGVGINGKISELNSAMGLSVLPHMETIISERKKVVDFYNANIVNLQRLKIRDYTEWNYSYYPVIFESESELIETEAKLNSKNIFPRRYFYPSLNKIKYLSGQKMPISESISQRILCLPIFAGLPNNFLEIISKTVNKRN